MATNFTDNNGREWRMHLTLGSIKEINEKTKLNLLDPWDGKTIDALAADPFRLGEVLATGVAPETEEEAVALAEGLRGVGLDNAMAALHEELASFFPAGQRRAYLLLTATVQKVQTAALADAEKTLKEHGTPSSETSRKTKPQKK